MIASAHPWWTLQSRRWGSAVAQRHGLLLSCLLGAGANSLLFYFIRPPGYNPMANLWATAIFFGLALWVPLRRAHTVLSNLALLTAVLLMAYITAHTGGIHSPAMVWLTIMAVPALLLLGRRWAFFWLGVVVLVLSMAFWAAQHSGLAAPLIQTPKTLLWATLDKVLVIMSLMLVVTFYDRMHQRQKQEVEQRNTQLEATQRALQQAQSHKDEFIASVGHELRTPMNAILGLNGVLQSELANQAEDMLMACHIRDSTQQLLRLVNDILDFSQLEAGRLSLSQTPVHLAHTLQQVLAGFEPRAQEKSLRLNAVLSPALPPWVLLDAQRLQQILENLLDNALKFTSSGSIRVGLAEQQGRLRFEVEDTGRGIAEDRQQQVFKRFEHADLQTKRAYGGTGLGLAICERLVSLQGGKMGVRSRPGHGSLFWFDLPLLAVAAPSQTGPKRDTQKPQQALRILLVDDNAVNLMVAQLVLEKCWPDVQVTQVASGQAAMAMLDTQSFDVVLMDVVMPQWDGLETTRRLRRHARADVARLPVLGLTASTLAHERERCLHAGMDEVLAKPLDAHTVHAIVERLAGRVERRQGAS